MWSLLAEPYKGRKTNRSIAKQPQLDTKSLDNYIQITVYDTRSDRMAREIAQEKGICGGFVQAVLRSNRLCPGVLSYASAPSHFQLGGVSIVWIALSCVEAVLQSSLGVAVMAFPGDKDPSATAIYAALSILASLMVVYFSTDAVMGENRF